MTTSPTPVIRDELSSALGLRAAVYWDTLNRYLTGKISRSEYEQQVRECIDSPPLVKLHNELILSILGSSSHHAPPTPPPDAPGKVKPQRKRRRALPYQGVDPNDPSSLRSSRLKRWTVGIGRKERERVKAMDQIAMHRPTEPRVETDEIARERGITLKPEGQDPPGTYQPVPLASTTRSPNTLQQVTERVALIAAQHNLKPPTRSVAMLMTLACEAKLKHLITQTLSLTATSHSVTSIQPSTMNALTRPSSRPLSTSSFDTLFSLSPFVLPNMSASATAMRLTLNDHTPYELSSSDYSAQSALGVSAGSGINLDLSSRKEVRFKERHVDDPRWQLLAILAERSSVRDALLDSKALELGAS